MLLELLDPLLDFVPNGQVCAHQRLFVDIQADDVVFSAWSSDSRRNRCSIGIDNDPEKGIRAFDGREYGEEQITHPSSIVSSKHSNTKSRFSRIPRFST